MLLWGRGDWNDFLVRLFLSFHKVLWVGVLLIGGMGCLGQFQKIDVRLVDEARLNYSNHRFAGFNYQSPYEEYDEDEFEEDDGYYEDDESEDSRPSLIIADLLAFFPGLFVHGLGHNYAGDHATARNLRSMGEWGYLLTGLGGGIGAGAYFLDQSNDNILPISLYITGGIVAGVGLAYFFSAWIMDMIDTPRAVKSGGAPWRFLDEHSGPFE